MRRLRADGCGAPPRASRGEGDGSTQLNSPAHRERFRLSNAVAWAMAFADFRLHTKICCAKNVNMLKRGYLPFFLSKFNNF